MIGSEKIGVGIITHNRPHLLDRLLESVSGCNWCDLVIINDGEHLEKDGWNYYIQNNETNLGVGKSKNKALRHLLDKECDHIFIIEDDIFIKSEMVFQKYIEASKASGIQHFNFSQHGIMNKVGYTNDGAPNPKLTIDYGSARVSLFGHCVGAFSYYSTQALQKCGLMDERYYNACEHVDHTYDIIKAGLHPPFWYFADIENSQDYLGDEPWTLQNSTISSRPDHKNLMSEADKIFLEKHHTLPGLVPLVKEEEVFKKLKEIKKNYGK